jgi:hypothetical protein
MPRSVFYIRRTEEMLQPETKVRKTVEGDIISPDNNEAVDGGVTLVTNPGAHYSKIANLKKVLSTDPNVKILTTGGEMGKGSWIRLFIKKPLPLYQVLYRMPDVLVVSRKGCDIQISML